MLTRILLTLCLTALLRAAVIPDGSREPDCGAFLMPFCTREYDPLCGTNGVTYTNQCMMCLDNLEQKINTFIRRRGSC